LSALYIGITVFDTLQYVSGPNQDVRGEGHGCCPM
jgi:hypothetical protein